jgi:curved DNA-binding protein CbpA
MSKSSDDFVDHYEILQLSSNASLETIERVYRLLAKRFHPDNPDTGNADKFAEVREAYLILSEPEKRAAYDASYDATRSHQWKIFDQDSASDNFKADLKIFQAILSLLYTSRRQDVDSPGLGVMHLEKFLGCPEEHLKFHTWYLRERGWIERLQNGQWAITVAGVDELSKGDVMLRKDRLLAESSVARQDSTRERRLNPAKEPDTKESEEHQSSEVDSWFEQTEK